jgi:uncharacterized protein YjdB
MALAPRWAHSVAVPLALQALLAACPGPTDPPPPPPGLARIEVTPTGVTFVSLGETAQLSAAGRTASGAPATLGHLTWQSRDPAVASVSATGVVTATGDGSTQVTVSSGTVTAEAGVTVARVVRALDVTPGTVTLSSLGETAQLAAAPRDAGGAPMPAATVAWVSSDPTVATVSGAGLVTAVTNGATTVTATSGAVSREVAVTVQQAARSITVTPATPPAELNEGGQLALVAQVRDSAGQAMSGQAVAWTSDSAQVATVDAAGLVRGIRAGSTRVRARLGGLEGSLELQVRGLLHRWTFSETGGTGTVFRDDLRGLHGRIVGVGPAAAVAVGGAVTLTGGPRGTADYVELPARLLRGKTDATIEVWATLHSLRQWSRVFDIGASTANYLFIAWSQGIGPSTDRTGFAVNGVEHRLDNVLAPFALGMAHHLVLAIDEGGGTNGATRLTLYLDGVRRGAFDTAHRLRDLVDEHFWLGRSHFTVDETAHASYDEVRIHDRVYSDAEIQQIHARDVAAVPPAIALSAGSLTFSVTHGGGNPGSQSVTIGNGGRGMLTGLGIGPISYGPGATGWLQPPALSATSAPATLTVQPVTTGLAPGTYTATVPIHSAGAASGSRNLAITLTVAPPGCVAPAPPSGGPFPGITNILVDLSHEYTFTYDFFTHFPGYWHPGFERTRNNASLASSSVPLPSYDIALVHLGETGIGFSAAELQRVDDWIRNGGGRLVLIARRTPQLPAAQLATHFGVDFLSTFATLPYQVKAHPATTGVSTFVAAAGSPPGTVLRSSCSCDVLVTDAAQRPVVLACPHGAGKVVAISEPGIIANPYDHPLVNVQFFNQLLAWLGPRPRPAASIPLRTLPEVTTPLAGGAKLLSTPHTAASPFVTVVGTEHPRIDQELERITGLQNVFQMTFVALPCAGGGYSGGAEVGVCAYASPGDLTLVFAHELMHSFDNPNPAPEMMHPVVSYVADLVGAALGGPAAAAAAGWQLAIDVGFKNADPTGTTLDVTNDALFDRRGKMYWIIGRLRGTYPFATAGLYNFPTAARDPLNLLKRYYQLKRADAGYTATPTNTVRLLSIAACRDLFPHFRAVGTTLGPTPGGLAAEIGAACP